MRRLLLTPAFGALASLRLRRSAPRRSSVLTHLLSPKGLRFSTSPSATRPTFCFGGGRCPACGAAPRRALGGAAAAASLPAFFRSGPAAGRARPKAAESSEEEERFPAPAPAAAVRKPVRPTANDALWFAGLWDAQGGAFRPGPAPALLLHCSAEGARPWLESLCRRWGTGAVEVLSARRLRLRISSPDWLERWLAIGAPALRSPALRAEAVALAAALRLPAPVFRARPSRRWAVGFAAATSPSAASYGHGAERALRLRAQSPRNVDPAAVAAFCDPAVVGFPGAGPFGAPEPAKGLWQVAAEAELAFLAALATAPGFPAPRLARRFALLGEFRRLAAAGAFGPNGCSSAGVAFLKGPWGHRGWCDLREGELSRSAPERAGPWAVGPLRPGALRGMRRGAGRRSGRGPWRGALRRPPGPRGAGRAGRVRRRLRRRAPSGVGPAAGWGKGKRARGRGAPSGQGSGAASGDVPPPGGFVGRSGRRRGRSRGFGGRRLRPSLRNSPHWGAQMPPKVGGRGFGHGEARRCAAARPLLSQHRGWAGTAPEGTADFGTKRAASTGRGACGERSVGRRTAVHRTTLRAARQRGTSSGESRGGGVQGTPLHPAGPLRPRASVRSRRRKKFGTAPEGEKNQKNEKSGKSGPKKGEKKDRRAPSAAPRRREAPALPRAEAGAKLGRGSERREGREGGRGGIRRRM